MPWVDRNANFTQFMSLITFTKIKISSFLLFNQRLFSRSFHPPDQIITLTNYLIEIFYKYSQSDLLIDRNRINAWGLVYLISRYVYPQRNSSCNVTSLHFRNRQWKKKICRKMENDLNICIFFYTMLMLIRKWNPFNWSNRIWRH